MKTIVQYLIFLFSLITVINPISVLADSTLDDHLTLKTTENINIHKSPDVTHEKSHMINKNRKKVLIEDSREMSPFFKLGIGINIVMILIFGWWFSTQWRANNKKGSK